MRDPADLLLFRNDDKRATWVLLGLIRSAEQCARYLAAVTPKNERALTLAELKEVTPLVRF